MRKGRKSRKGKVNMKRYIDTSSWIELENDAVLLDVNSGSRKERKYKRELLGQLRSTYGDHMFGEGGAPQKSGSWGGFKRFFWGSDAVKIVEHVGTRLVALEFAVKSEDLDATRKVASEGPTVMANLDKALKGLVAEIESLDAAKIPAALAGLEKKVEDKTDDVVGAWQDVLSDVLGKAPLPTAAPAVIIKFWTDTKAKVKTLRDEFKELRAHVRAAEKLIESIQ